MKYFTIVLFAVSSLLYSQTNDCSCNYIEDYYPLVYNGHYEYLKENYDEAYDYMKQAEFNCPLLNLEGIYEPIILSELTARKELYAETAKYIEMDLRDGQKFEYFEFNPVYEGFLLSEQGEKLKTNSQKIYDEWYAGLNLELRKELVEMIKEDQRVRKSINGEYDWSEMKRVDSLNVIRLKEIFTEYGYPNPKLIGQWHLDDEFADVFALIMHIYKEEDVEYFKSALYEFVKCGKSTLPQIYAMLVDSNDRGRGIYTYGIYDNLKDDDIEDIENLDKRRISVGLRPYWMEKEVQQMMMEKYK